MQQANQPFGAPQPTGVNQPLGQAQPFGLPGPFAQYPPYAAPAPYGQPFGQQPLGMPDLYAQPQPTPYAQVPFTQAPVAQVPFTQAPVAQAPAPQAAPVPPVSCPVGVGGAGSPPAAQNPYARQLVPIARTLEQAIPGYQILMSVLGGLGDSPRAESLGVKTPFDLLRDLCQQHFCALGAIRRMLCGELTSEAMLALALAAGRLDRIHTLLRPEMERLVMGAPPELRASLSGLNQMLTNATALNAQALSGVQSLVGPQVWEAAKNKSA